MKSSLRHLTLRATALTLGLAISSTFAMTAQQISVVPGADAVGSIALKAFNAAPVVKKKRATGNDEAIPWSAMTAAKRARFEVATGLAEDDIIAAAFSCDMDTLDLDADTSRGRSSSLRGLVAIQVSKAISIDKLKTAIKLEYGTQDLAGVADVAIGKQVGLKVNASKPSDPDIYLTLTPDGHIVLIALNTESLAAALDRAASGSLVREPSGLTQMRRALSGSQIQMACIIPTRARESMQAKIDGMRQQMSQNPGLAMVMGFTQLFKGIKSLSVGLSVDTDATLKLAGELGSEQEALQASVLLETMVIPLILAQAATAGVGEKASELGKNVSVKSHEATLQIQVTIPEDQIMGKAKTTPTVQ